MSQTGVLYIVTTPIGNLGDFSERANRALSECGLIAAEDTRVTGKLLSYFDIHTPMISYYEGKREEKGRKRILDALLQGKDVALVTDAGSPAISDPGFRVVRDAVAAGIVSVVVPGPCAVIAGLQLSGLPTDRFAFFGFLPKKGKDRTETMERMAEFSGTVVIYESPLRAAQTLGDLSERFGSNECAVCRELTKLHEQVLRGPLEVVAAQLEQNPPRGEVTIVLSTRTEQGADENQAVRKAKQLKGQLGLSDKDAATAAAIFTDVSKNRIYKSLIADKE